MHSEDLAMRTMNRVKVAVMLALVGAVGLAPGLACSACPLIKAQMLVRGRVETDGTMTLGSLEISAYTWTAGENTGTGGATNSPLSASFIWEDGTFEGIIWGNEFGRCPNPFSSEVEIPEYPVPDEVHLVVTHAGCEHVFEIEVTGDMLSEDHSSDVVVIQLTEPLVIGPCPEE